MRMVESSRHLADHMAEVPLLVVPCILDRLAPDAGPAEVAGFYGGILPAVWSFQLALRSRGLGSAWTTLHLEYEREVGELLDIPDDGHPGRPAPGRPLHGRGLQAGAATPRRGDHILGQLEGALGVIDVQLKPGTAVEEHSLPPPR